MDKQSLTKDMRAFTGGKSFISTSAIAKYRGCSRDRMPELLAGLDFMRDGRSKQYFIPDVAERLMERRMS